MKPSISAVQLKDLRTGLGLSSRQAAELVALTTRQWIKYESGDANIPEKVVEYFCLKTKLPYPPIDQDGNLVNRLKKILVTNMKGGVGKTLLTYHVGSLLQNEGSKVLLIDASNNHTLIQIYERTKSYSFKCPKVISIDECKNIKELSSEYDYLIYDANIEYAASILKTTTFDLIITPTYLSYFDVESTKKTHHEISKYTSLVNTYALIIGYDPCCIAKDSETVDDENAGKDRMDLDIIEMQDMCYGNLKTNKVKMFDSFSTRVFDYHKYKINKLEDFLLIIQHQPGSWVIKELESIKNEIKQKIYGSTTC